LVEIQPTHFGEGLFPFPLDVAKSAVEGDRGDEERLINATELAPARKFRALNAA
jgi:hypothetical protein